MADAAVDKKDAAPEEVSSTEVSKESPVKKSPAKPSPAKPVVEVPETNGTEEKNGGGDAPQDTPAENGDSEDRHDATENGDATEKKDAAAVKRKSTTAGDNDVADKTTPEKKAKVTEEAPAEVEEVAA